LTSPCPAEGRSAVPVSPAHAALQITADAHAPEKHRERTA